MRLVLSNNYSRFATKHLCACRCSPTYHPPGDAHTVIFDMYKIYSSWSRSIFEIYIIFSILEIRDAGKIFVSKDAI
jgi:hypothetical protein